MEEEINKLDELGLEENELAELGDEEPDTEPQEKPTPISKSDGEDSFKELLHIKYKDGSETQLGSCSVDIQRLCELSHLIKLNLLNDVKKEIPNYYG